MRQTIIFDSPSHNRQDSYIAQEREQAQRSTGNCNLQKGLSIMFSLIMSASFPKPHAKTLCSTTTSTGSAEYDMWHQWSRASQSANTTNLLSEDVDPSHELHMKLPTRVSLLPKALKRAHTWGSDTTDGKGSSSHNDDDCRYGLLNLDYSRPNRSDEECKEQEQDWRREISQTSSMASIVSQTVLQLTTLQFTASLMNEQEIIWRQIQQSNEHVAKDHAFATTLHRSNSKRQRTTCPSNPPTPPQDWSEFLASTAATSTTARSPTRDFRDIIKPNASSQLTTAFTLNDVAHSSTITAASTLPVLTPSSLRPNHDDDQTIFVQGRRVKLSGIRRVQDAFAQGNTDIIKCIGCGRNLLVSKECTIVFCPECETLAPKHLQTRE
jgi:hypothetical protein